MSKLITSFHAELNEASYSGSIPREWRVANEFERILGGASLRALPRMPFWNSPCTAFIPLHLSLLLTDVQICGVVARVISNKLAATQHP